MAVPIRHKFNCWIFDHLLWTRLAQSARDSARIVADTETLPGSCGSVLAVREWVEHHRPEIAIVALIHFVFVLTAMSLLVYTGQ
jgi:hypothetical protein